MTIDWSIQKAALGKDLLISLYEQRLLRTWLRDQPMGWEIVSGRWSPFYISMRNVPSRPSLFRLVVRAAAELIKNEVPKEATRLIGLAATGIPIAAAVAYELKMPMGYNRKLPGIRTLRDLQQHTTQYGGHSLVEGDFQAGDKVIIFDDVVSHFDSKEVAIKQLALEMDRRGIPDVSVAAVVVLIDRGSTAEERATELGIPFSRLVSLGKEGIEMLNGVASERELEVIRTYIREPESFQDGTTKESLRLEGLAPAETRL